LDERGLGRGPIRYVSPILWSLVFPRATGALNSCSRAATSAVKSPAASPIGDQQLETTKALFANVMDRFTNELLAAAVRWALVSYI